MTKTIYFYNIYKTWVRVPMNVKVKEWKSFSLISHSHLFQFYQDWMAVTELATKIWGYSILHHGWSSTSPFKDDMQSGGLLGLTTPASQVGVSSSKEILCTTPSGVPAVLFPRSRIAHALISSGFDNSMRFTWGYLEDHPKMSRVLEYSGTKQ